MNDLAVPRQRGGFDDLILPIDFERLGLRIDQRRHKIKDVLGVQGRRIRREPAGDVRMTDDLDPIDIGYFTQHREFAVTPLLYSKVDDDGPDAYAAPCRH